MMAEKAKVLKFESKEQREIRKKRERAIRNVKEAAKKLHW
jgi:hypothetical protein